MCSWKNSTWIEDDSKVVTQFPCLLRPPVYQYYKPTTPSDNKVRICITYPSISATNKCVCYGVRSKLKKKQWYLSILYKIGRWTIGGREILLFLLGDIELNQTEPFFGPKRKESENWPQTKIFYFLYFCNRDVGDLKYFKLWILQGQIAKGLQHSR